MKCLPGVGPNESNIYIAVSNVWKFTHLLQSTMRLYMYIYIYVFFLVNIIYFVAVFFVANPDPDCTNMNQYCDDWAAAGHCTRNPEWMNANCPVSCDQCTGQFDYESF